MNIKTAVLLLPFVSPSHACPPDPLPQGNGNTAASATNQFAIDLYRHLAKRDPGNLFLSPYSIATALAMTAEGAREETLAQMRRILHLGDGPMADVHASFGALQRRLVGGGGDTSPQVLESIVALRARLAKLNAAASEAANRSKWKEANEAEGDARRTADELNRLLATVDRYELRVANSLWFEHTAPPLPAFLAALGRHYGTGRANALDFRGDPSGARRRINDWVGEQTARRILDLIPAHGIDTNTRLVLANAVYFRGEWAEPFEERSTTDADFMLSSGMRSVVRLMRDEWREGVPYAAFTGAGEYFDTPRTVPAHAGAVAPSIKTYPGAGGFQIIELPYKGGDLAMTILLPQTPDGLSRLEEMLTAERLTQWLGKLDRREVDTALPRWSQRSACELGGALQALGMQRAFTDPRTGHGAQFAGMNAETDPTRQLFVGEVFHQAFVEITEKGTEAAAATAVVMAVGSAVRPIEMVPFRPVFRADHPFVFLIRDRSSGAVLFVGRVLDPNA